ncbi:MAG TPA: AMP-binding protein [Steroidobacteraceae bacterium]|nr:AMP-binding protein [Steroidobacteraceae bacterium]
MEKIWLRHYPPGTPAEVTLDPAISLVDVLRRSCERFGSAPAFHNLGTTLTFDEVHQRSHDFAAGLSALGLRKGERIALMMPNLLQYPIAMFGALRAGLVVVNTNPLYTPRELEHQLRDCGAVAIVVLANFAHVVEKVIARTELRHVIVTQVGDLLRFPKGAIVNWAARRIKHMVPPYRLPAALSFRQVLGSGARASFTAPTIDGNDLAFLQYTGGTTGVAKGAMLTHRNLVANLEQVSALWRGIIEDGNEIAITPLPLYHVFCMTCNCLTFFKHGCLNVLITNPRDLPAFIDELARWPFTFISGVNTLYNALLNHPAFARLDFSRLKLGVAGGMALHPSVAERWRALTGRDLIEGYGLTESSPVVACNLPGASRIGTVGVPLPSTEVSIRDEHGELPLGSEGELCVRGPQVMRGYWQMPDETAHTLDAEGWLHTGDIARIEDDGFVRIVDRKKDMIIVSGFKVFPNEVETVLATHSAVVEAGCVGVPDDRSGQAVKAFIVARETVTVEQVREFCREHMTAYKVPKYVEFRSTLPKTPIGKILRRALTEVPAGNAHDNVGTGTH